MYFTNDWVWWYKRATFPIPRAPGPASYTLPPVLGPNTVVTPAALAYSISGRNKVDRDLNKVLFILKYVIMKIIYFTNICCCCCVRFPLRVQDLPTKLWTRLSTDRKLPSTAWQAATSHQMTPQGSQDLVPTIPKRSSSCIGYAKRQNLSILLSIFSMYSQVTLSKPRAPSFTFGIRHSQYISSLVVDTAAFSKWSHTRTSLGGQPAELSGASAC